MSSTLTDMAAEMLGITFTAEGGDDPAQIIAKRLAAGAVALPERRVAVSYDHLRDLMVSLGLRLEVDPG